METLDSAADWIEFHNFNYWFTAAGDHDLASPVERVRHYSLFPDCAPRIRSWRATSTNIRHFNYNSPLGGRCETKFNLRYYPMRSYTQMQRRLTADRANLERGGLNFHYANMMRHPDRLLIAPSALHIDDGSKPAVACAKTRLVAHLWGPGRHTAQTGQC